MTPTLTIALSKGRIFKETLPLLAAAAIVPTDDPETSRKLILDTNQPDVKLVIIRATDVPTYVQYGAADLGVAGKDVLLEHGGEGLYEPLDLKIARCRLMVAGDPEHRPRLNRTRIATKYINTTRRFFAGHGIADYRIVESLGATEGAPATGAADLIVDITSTGATLRDNGLKILADGVILKSEAHLVASRDADWGAGQLVALQTMLGRLAPKRSFRALLGRLGKPAG